MRNCSGFAKDFGLVPGLLEELALAGDVREMFLMKLNMIYQAILRVQEREAVKKAQEK